MFNDFFASSPFHFFIDSLLIIFVVYLLLQKRYKPKRDELSESAKRELIEEWNPSPLVPKDYKKWNVEPTIIESGDAVLCLVNGKETINMSSASFFGLNKNEEVIKTAKEAIIKYGVGSCGPRGFYGTFDVHINLEKRISEFLGADRAIVYSSAYATISSIIPAFSKRNDIIFYDESCCQSIQVGINLSRSKAIPYKHNNISDLEAKLKKVELEDKAQNRKLYKKFVIVEGVFYNTGNICNFKEIFQIKEKYKFRVIVEDSYGFGVLGETGRGTLEHLGYKTTDVEILCGNLGTVLGAVGGFAVGDHIITHHQKLNSNGFIFSASSPPYLMACADKSIEIISQSGKKFLTKFRDNLNHLRQKISEQLSNYYNVGGNVSSPIIHLRLQKQFSREETIVLLDKIVSSCLDKGVLFSSTKYVPLDFNPPFPSLRVTVTSEHSTQQIDLAVNSLLNATIEVLGK